MNGPPDDDARAAGGAADAGGGALAAPPPGRRVRVRLAALLWAAGLPGAIVLATTTVPVLAAAAPPPLPVAVLVALSVAQAALLLALAVAVGAWLAPGLGLRAPAFEALAEGRSPRAALRAQLPAGAIGGVGGAIVLVAYAALAPEPLAGAARDGAAMPLAVRVLYGGLTEELLVRWGLTTALARGCVALLQRGGGRPSAASAWVAVGLGALAFAAGHLPAAHALAGPLPPQAIAAVLAANAAFGVIAGLLYWRRGLEAAMIAHALAHVLAWAATG